MDQDMEVIGRQQELAVIGRAVERVLRRDPAAVWIEGEAGSGKSTLVERAISMFLASGNSLGCRQVWRATGDAEEQVIEHGVADQLLSRARSGAGRQGSAGVSRSAELLGRLAAAVEDATVMVVLDDAHWCDHSSRQAIRFLLRRLVGMPVLVLVAHRPMGAWPADTRRASADLHTDVLELGGLGVAEVRQLMAARGMPLTPRAGRRLHDHTGGSPQLLTALAEELNHDELASGVGPLPAPRSFMDWVHDAFRDAPAEVRAVVAASTVLGKRATLPQISAMTSLNQPEAAVDDAISRRLLRLVVQGDERLVDVSHALVRSAVSEAMGFQEFAHFHQRAAGLAVDPVRAMVHRLHACGHTDVALLDEAVALAEEQSRAGAFLAAVRLLVMAGELLPAGGRRRELWVRAANLLLVIGELRWAEKLLAEVSAGGDGSSPAELLVNSHLALQLREPVRARELAEEAWQQGRDPRVVAGAAELLAFLGMDVGDGEAASTWAARAIEAADTRLVELRWAGTVWTSAWALRGDLAPAWGFLAQQVRRLTGTGSEPDVLLGLALTQLWTGQLGLAAESLERVRQVTGASAVLRSTARLASAELAFRTGRWDEVLATTDSELALVDEGWESRTAPMTLAVGAYVCAARGEWDRAEGFIERAESLLEADGNLPARTMVSVAKGRLALSLGRLDDVVRELEPLRLDERTATIPEGVHAWRADLAVAYVDLGRLDDAEEVLSATPGTSDDPHAHAGILRASAALAAAQGAASQALDLLAGAIAPGPEVVGPYVLARAQLALGALLRRQGQRRAGAEHLQNAMETFEGLGAEPSVVVARQELEVSVRRRGTAEGELTPAEENVARLAVSGHTNREIAQALTVSIKTVETHMGRIFTKLGVRHRVELVTVLSDADPATPASTRKYS